MGKWIRTESNGNMRNLYGQRFGRLIAIKPLGMIRSKDRHISWLCQCDCGKEHIALSTSLQQGKCKSCGCLKKLKAGEAALNSIFSNYKRNARIRKIEFNLSKTEFRILTKKDCYYCGASPSQERKTPNYNGSYIYNGIDRVDNTQGYIKDNCVPCCIKCNRAKDRMTQEDFLGWIQGIYKKHFGGDHGKVYSRQCA